jgi:sigma-B regulation protein RsbU (phosphoserine phosphatase)
MDDAYKTGDEIEVLANTFGRLSDKMQEYLKNILTMTAEKERVGTELSIASKIQTDMLPEVSGIFAETKEFLLSASMTPAKEVGGDFYDFFMINDDHLCLVIADVSGKGVPAALFMMASKIIIEDHAKIGKSPAQVLHDTNKALCAKGQSDMFVTIWIGVLEISTGKLTAADGGHEYPVILKHDGVELYKEHHGIFVGGIEGIDFTDYEIQLNPGDKVFVYTDGVPEAMNSDKCMFGLERMCSTLGDSKNGTPEEILKHMEKTVDSFAGDAEQFDDLTMLCLEYKGSGS